MTREPAASAPDGILVVDKPEGPTSHDVVQRARRALGLRRIGHTGTLDPMATGVLVLMLGGATRLAPQMTGHVKTYQGQGRLGWATDTYDRTGEATTAEPCRDLPHRDLLAGEAATFTGKILQSPPAYSARKVDGVPLYRHARRGNKIEGKAVEVEIMSFTVEPVADDLFCFTARVSAGTYIRSLIHDLGQRLGCGAHLESLRRVQAGPFTLEQAIQVKNLSRESLDSPSFVPFHRITLDLPTVQVDPDGEENLRQGRPARTLVEPSEAAVPGHPPATASPQPGLVQVRNGKGHLVALASQDPAIAGLYRPRRVFPPVPEALT